ncbi:hypothetical protein KFE25_002723 [Diacronema lutheri]|uniref:Uncharacterized protein n=2 Tax=Diacronema lutheri TaxID=2081491 RepID=A0A8J5XB84_DIALT|nr:hypothetical protein KFE25_002723 [Diacronema lutheri]
MGRRCAAAVAAVLAASALVGGALSLAQLGATPVLLAAEGWSPLSLFMSRAGANTTGTAPSGAARWKGLHIISAAPPSPTPTHLSTHPPPRDMPAAPPSPPAPPAPPPVPRARAAQELVAGSPDTAADALPVPPGHPGHFCGDRHWPASMLSTSPRDCRAAVAALPRSRMDGSLLVYFAFSQELGFCYGCTRDEVADAQPDPRFVMYETFAPEFTRAALAGGALPARSGGSGGSGGGDGGDSGHGASGGGASGGASDGAEAVACYDRPRWLSPGLLGCADLARGGHCVAGLVVDERVHGGWRGGYPERNCCACGGGLPREWSPSPPLSPPAPLLSRSAGPCTDLPSGVRAGPNGERTQPWTEPTGLGCGVFEVQGWCAAGSISRFAGPAHNNPEVHCCACGGGSSDPDRLKLPPTEHLGCVRLSSMMADLPVAIHSARVSSLAVVNLGPVGGGRKHRGRAAVDLCAERCVAFDFFAVGPSPRGAGTPPECVCYSLDSRAIPLTRVCDAEAEADDSVHVYAHRALRSDAVSRVRPATGSAAAMAAAAAWPPFAMVEAQRSARAQPIDDAFGAATLLAWSPWRTRAWPIAPAAALGAAAALALGASAAAIALRRRASDVERAWADRLL